MSVIKALKDYIQKYDGMDIVVLTDRTDDRVNSYALFPSGGGKSAEDVLGNRRYIKNYVFLAKRAVTEEFERQENYDFLEGFCDWVEANSSKGIYPVLDEGMTVEDISVANIMLMDLSDGWDIGTYQIQINLTYVKYGEMGML